ncbi:MAG: tRNA threonylcarbamoyladenosine dehydratase, partial [Lachnospiraceae bacterium]|nr:tRNA threonylcarbamoyladenosine dehydratase [Lachnospiraceae bacterium]
DDDKVSLTNLNRQIIATQKTIGRDKVEVMKERMLEINPDTDVRIYKRFFLPENEDEFPFAEYDYIVDAVDTVTAKIALVMKAREKGIPVISSMGAGNKLNADMFRVSDIYQTNVCPLAKVMRRELKKRGVEKLKVVYSEEKPLKPQANSLLDTDIDQEHSQKRAIPGSIAFVPSVAGLIIAGEVIKDLCEINT